MRLRDALALLVLAPLALAACAPADGPHIIAIAPPEATRGTTVMLVGEGFCGPVTVRADGECVPGPPPGHVAFNLEPPIVRATIALWRDGRMDILVPEAVDTGTTTVYVTVDGRSSNGVTFEVLP